jgi:hypothetical protein
VQLCCSAKSQWNGPRCQSSSPRSLICLLSTPTTDEADEVSFGTFRTVQRNNTLLATFKKTFLSVNHPAYLGSSHITNLGTLVLWTCGHQLSQDGSHRACGKLPRAQVVIGMARMGRYDAERTSREPGLQTAI